MRRKENEVTDRAQMEEILKKGRVLRLAMVCLANNPYVVPLNYGYKDGTFYIHSAVEGKKVAILTEKPYVYFEVTVDDEIIPSDKPCKWTAKYACVMGTGKVHIDTDQDAKIKGYDILMAHHGAPQGEYAEKALEKSVILRLEVTSMTCKQHL